MVEFDDLQFVEIKNIPPSDLILPTDNWRETPNIDTDRLAKSIAIALWYAPIAIKNKEGKFITLDGNRRTYACQQLEKGYKTTINGTKVTLYLPSTWRVSLITNYRYEDLTPGDIAKIRYHSTMNTIPFSQGALLTKVRTEAEAFCAEQGLAFSTIRSNRILNEKLLDYLATKIGLDRGDVVQLLGIGRKQGQVPYTQEVLPLLFNGELGKNIAQGLSAGVEKVKVQKLIEIIRQKKNDDITETHLAEALLTAKSKAMTGKMDIVEAFQQTTEGLQPIKTISTHVPSALFHKINHYRQITNQSWDDFMLNIILNNWSQYTGESVIPLLAEADKMRKIVATTKSRAPRATPKLPP